MRRPDLLVPALALALAAGLFAHACGRAPSQELEASGLDSGASPLRSAAPEAPAPRQRGNVSFSVRDPAGQPIPCKLTLLGRDGTPNPDLGMGLPTAAIEGGMVAYHRVFSLTGSGAFVLPKGTYDVYVSRGLEWSLHVEELRVGEEPVSLAATLTRAVAQEGWLSADMHVHAAPSWDSSVPLPARVYEFASEGVDVLVSTDHNIVTDYRPEIERAGARDLLGTIAGSEISTTDWGHFGAFPMRDERGWWVLHGVRMNGMRPDELLGALRRHGPSALVTVNHPRLGKMGYFSVGGFDPRSGRFAKSRVSFEFDAIEVMNGAKHGSVQAVERVLADWFGLLRSGRRVTAVGNSDTHEIQTSYAGYPRNYVRFDDPAPAVDGDRMAAAFREGHSFFTSGPFVEARVADKSYGELVRARDGRVNLEVKILAPDWVAVSRLRIYVNGEVKRDLAVAAGTGPVRFSDTLAIETPADAFVVVRVDGDRALPPVVGGPGDEPLTPVAITNPIYVDADGDGKYRAER